MLLRTLCSPRRTCVMAELGKQCAAVRMWFLVIRLPPQTVWKLLPPLGRPRTAADGQAPMGASVPPTMRTEVSGKRPHCDPEEGGRVVASVGLRVVVLRVVLLVVVVGR